MSTACRRDGHSGTTRFFGGACAVLWWWAPLIQLLWTRNHESVNPRKLSLMIYNVIMQKQHFQKRVLREGISLSITTYIGQNHHQRSAPLTAERLLWTLWALVHCATWHSWLVQRSSVNWWFWFYHSIQDGVARCNWFILTLDSRPLAGHVGLQPIKGWRRRFWLNTVTQWKNLTLVSIYLFWLWETFQTFALTWKRILQRVIIVMGT